MLKSEGHGLGVNRVTWHQIHILEGVLTNTFRLIPHILAQLQIYRLGYLLYSNISVIRYRFRA